MSALLSNTDSMRKQQLKIIGIWKNHSLEKSQLLHNSCGKRQRERMSSVSIL